MCLPTAPGLVIGSVPAAVTAAQNAIAGVVDQYVHPTVRYSARIRAAIKMEASRIARLALAQFTFGALPRDNVDASVIAGDFNVHYPDNTRYTPQQQNHLGGANAYAALAAAAGSNARNTAATTRTGPSAFHGQRVYTLKIPVPIQHWNTTANDYVPLDMRPLANAPTSYVGYNAWITALQSLARAQNVSWATLEADPFAGRLTAAFDMEVINDTSFYRSSCYDNVFVRGDVVRSGMIDVMSELGSWSARLLPVPNPQPAIVPNPWQAAAGTLNAIARQQLSVPGTNLRFEYGNVTYDITPALADAEDAAVFFGQFISDHLPVFVEIRI
jgi:hypothetical protein